jgi:hypothetical protein
VDECALNTGQVLMAKIGLDGAPKDVYCVNLLDLFDPYMRIQGLGKSVEEQMERFQSNKHWLKKEA